MSTIINEIINIKNNKVDYKQLAKYYTIEQINSILIARSEVIVKISDVMGKNIYDYIKNDLDKYYYEVKGDAWFDNHESHALFGTFNFINTSNTNWDASKKFGISIGTAFETYNNLPYFLYLSGEEKTRGEIVAFSVLDYKGHWSSFVHGSCIIIKHANEQPFKNYLNYLENLTNKSTFSNTEFITYDEFVDQEREKALDS